MHKPSATRFITLDELCQQLAISKATFYKHQRLGVFPEPKRTSGGRLVFDQALVEQCLNVVRTRTGLNGEPVVFSTRKKRSTASPTTKGTPAAKQKHEETIRALASLGLTATAEDIERTSKGLPADLPEPERIRQLFLALRNRSGTKGAE